MPQLPTDTKRSSKPVCRILKRYTVDVTELVPGDVVDLQLARWWR